MEKNCQTRIASSFARYIHLTLLAGLVRAADGLSRRVGEDLKGVRAGVGLSSGIRCCHRILFIGRCGSLVGTMNPPNPQPKIHLNQTAEYREIYSNSVQVRVSVWDFLLVFGLVHQESPDEVNVNNALGVYLSPQQAKALWNVLGQNLAQYEQTFGQLALEPQPPKGPVH